MFFFSARQPAVNSHLIPEFEGLNVNDTHASSGTTDPPSPTPWKPDFFRPWPFKEGEDLPSKPWSRPEQTSMSFVGELVLGGVIILHPSWALFEH